MSDNTPDNPATPATPTGAPEAKAAKRRTWPKKDAGASKGTGQKKDHVPRDLYAEATNKIIAAMEKGTAPWQRPWDYKNILAPQNGASGHQYTGINPILLMIAAYETQERAAEAGEPAKAYTDPRWATWDQAKDKGWNVKPGEKGTTIYFFKPMEVEVKDDQGKPVIDTETGEIKMKTIPMLKSYAVFNMAQMENPPPAMEATKGHDWDPILAAENVVKSMGVPIMEGTDRAYYSPKLDTVTMPPRDSFKTPNDYYSVLLHELGHATGGKQRLARDQSGRFGTPEYAYEELIAEMTSMYTSLDVGIFSDANVDRHAAYFESWISALKNDKKLIFKAAKEAERAADWVMDRDRTPANDKAPRQKAEKVITPAVELGSTVKFVSEGQTIEGMVVDSRKGFGDTYQYQIKQANDVVAKVWSSKGTMEVVAAPTEPFVKPEAKAKEAKEPVFSTYLATSVSGVEKAISDAGFEVKQAVDGKWYYQEKGSAPSEDAVLLTGKYAAASNAVYECAKDKNIEAPKTVVGVRVGKSNLIRFENPGELDTFVRENPDKLPAKTVEEVMAKFNEIHDKTSHVIEVTKDVIGNSPEELQARANGWIPNTYTPEGGVMRLGEFPSDTEVQDYLMENQWKAMSTEQADKLWDGLSKDEQDAHRWKLQVANAWYAMDWNDALAHDARFPEDIPAVHEQTPVPDSHVSKNAEGALVFVHAGQSQVIENFDHLSVLLNQAEASGESINREGIESQYWQQIPAEAYEALSEKLFQDRYGIGLGDITDLERVKAEQSCGNHPAAMVEVLAVKYNLSPKTEVAHPYGLSTLQPGLHFNPTQGVAAPAVLVPEQHFSNNQPGSGLGM